MCMQTCSKCPVNGSQGCGKQDGIDKVVEDVPRRSWKKAGTIKSKHPETVMHFRLIVFKNNLTVATSTLCPVFSRPIIVQYPAV